MNEHIDCPLKDQPPDNILRITPRERNVLQLLADGHTRNELGAHLGATASEIDFLLGELLTALGAATQTEAIAAARKRGLLRSAAEAGMARMTQVPGRDPHSADGSRASDGETHGEWRFHQQTAQCAARATRTTGMNN